jgi:hypothetical protein
MHSGRRTSGRYPDAPERHQLDPHDDLSVTLFASGGLAPTMTARRVRGWDQFCRPPDIADRPT